MIQDLVIHDLDSCRKLLGILIVGLSLLCSGATAETIVIFPPTRVGDSIDLVQISTRERSVNGQAPTKGSSTTPIHLEVLAASDDETVIGWTVGRAKIDGQRFNPQVAAVTDPLVDLVAGQTIELVLDEEFTPSSIRNLDEVMTLSQKMVDAMEKSLPDDPAKAAVIPRVREMFSNRETMQNLMMQQPGRYFLAYGWELEAGVPREVEMSLPSPFGGAPLPAKVTIELMPWQDADEHYVVTYRQDLDQAALKQFLAAAMQKFAANKTAPDDQLPQFDVQDRAEFRINRETLWVEDAVVTRTTSSDAGSQVDRLEFHPAN